MPPETGLDPLPSVTAVGYGGAEKHLNALVDDAKCKAFQSAISSNRNELRVFLQLKRHIRKLIHLTSYSNGR